MGGNITDIPIGHTYKYDGYKNKRESQTQKYNRHTNLKDIQIYQSYKYEIYGYIKDINIQKT